MTILTTTQIALLSFRRNSITLSVTWSYDISKIDSGHQNEAIKFQSINDTEYFCFIISGIEFGFRLEILYISLLLTYKNQTLFFFIYKMSPFKMFNVEQLENRYFSHTKYETNLYW